MMHVREKETADGQEDIAADGQEDIARQKARPVAGGQDHEVRYEAKKMVTSKAKVKRVVKKAGPSRKRVERAL